MAPTGRGPRVRLPGDAASARRALNVALVVAAVLALLVLLLPGGGSPGIEIERRDPPFGVDEIRVDVGGAVARPGVVTVAPGARVADAIEAAGGALPGAEVGALNLALRLRDQDRVRVPAAGEAATPLLDVNRASAAELEALPGIGPVYAARVLDSRDSEGAYPTVEALQERGVLPAHVFEQVRTLLVAR